MYIVETSKASVNEKGDAYHLVGVEAEITQFIRNVGSLALESIDGGVLDADDGYNLLASLYRNAFDVVGIPSASKSTFDALLKDSGWLARERRRRLLDGAVEGGLSVNVFWDEFEALNELEYHGAYDGTNSQVTRVNRSGQVCVSDHEDSSFKLLPETDFEGAFGTDSPETKVAKELGLDVFVSQYELIQSAGGGESRIASGFEHTTIGKLDKSGSFKPIVTVLAQNHPLRKSPEQQEDDEGKMGQVSFEDFHDYAASQGRPKVFASTLWGRLLRNSEQIFYYGERQRHMTEDDERALAEIRQSGVEVYTDKNELMESYAYRQEKGEWVAIFSRPKEKYKNLLDLTLNLVGLKTLLDDKKGKYMGRMSDQFLQDLIQHQSGRTSED